MSQNLMLVKVGFTVAGLTVFDIYGVVTNTMRSTVLSCEMVVVHWEGTGWLDTEIVTDCGKREVESRVNDEE